MRAGCSLGVRFCGLLVELMLGLSPLVLDLGDPRSGKPFSKVAGGGLGTCMRGYLPIGRKYFSILISLPANYHPCLETDSLYNVF